MKNLGIILTLFCYLFPPLTWAGEGHEDHHEHGEESATCNPSDQGCKPSGSDAHTDEHEHEHGEESAGVVLSEGTLLERGITLETAGQGKLAKVLKVNGRVGADQNKLAHIHPRFPGIVRDVRKNLGDSVEKGQPLAIIESNQSLQPYEVVSLISGTVLFRHATIGEYVTEAEPIFVVADLSSLWVDLYIFPRDFSLVKEGLNVRVRPPHASEWLESTVSFVSRVADERTQARVARTVLEAKTESLYPDQYVEAEIVLETVPVPLAVAASAVQRIGDETIVFVKAGDGYEPKEVVTGRSDGEVTEILSGLAAGDKYAAGSTYLLKAELGKGSAEHEH